MTVKDILIFYYGYYNNLEVKVKIQNNFQRFEILTKEKDLEKFKDYFNKKISLINFLAPTSSFDPYELPYLEIICR